MPADLRIDPDAVDDLARLALRVADDLGGAAAPGTVSGAVAELRAFAGAAERAARQVREADRDAADRFSDCRCPDGRTLR